MISGLFEVRQLIIIPRLKRDRNPEKFKRPVDISTPIHPSSRLPAQPAPTIRRKWLFRLLAAVVLPLMFGITLEMVLRLAGYGYPTDFFLPKTVNGKSVLVENASFGFRFFPPALARSPYPLVMQPEKPAGVYRVFLFGESAALGDPRPAYGVGRYLETLLRDRFPGAEFEVVCAAMTAINSHAILPIARECARYQGDLWIIYMGNNEMAGPFGANTVFGAQAPPSMVVRASLAVQRTRLVQWLAAQTRKLNPSASQPASWGGLRMFLEHQLPPSDPRKERVYANFRRNLADILRVARRSGVPVILSSVASNLKDCAPFGSLHSPPLSGSSLSNWENRCQAGATNAGNGQWSEAATAFQEAVQLSPQFAEPHFRLGESFLELSNIAKARENFFLARDLDALPFRADSKINALIEMEARKNSANSVFHLDSEKVLASLSSANIPGQESFYEHVHLNFDGNYRLGRAMAEQTAAILPAHLTSRQTPAWAEPEACAQRLGLTDWNRLTVLEEIGRRLSDAPFTNQFNQAKRLKHLSAQMASIKGRLDRPAVQSARATYEEAIKFRPLDHWLHHNYAEFLAAVGDLNEAAAQMQAVRDLAPHHYAAYFQVGRLLARQKKYAEAQQSFQAALRLRPDVADIYLELGQIMAIQGHLPEALQNYDAAQALRLEDARLFLLRADVLEKQQKRGPAMESLRQAIRLRPAYGEARYFLGVALVKDAKYPEAQAEFEEVVRLRPDHVMGHLNLGLALARQDKFDEALACFEAVVRLDPQNQQARQFLETIQRVRNASSTPSPAPR